MGSLTPNETAKINTLMNSRNYQELLNYIDELLKEKELAELHNVKGITFMNLAEYEKAEECFRKAIALKDDAVYHSNLADSLIMLKKYEEAEQEIKKAISMNKQFAHCYLIYSKLLANRKEYEEAIKVLDQGLEAIPENLELLKKKEYLTNMLILIKKTENFELVLVDYAKAELSEKKYHTAIALCESSLTIKETKEAHNTIGICYVNVGELKQALKHFRRAYELDNKFYDALRNLANTYANMKKHQKAIEIYNKLVLKDQKPRWFYERALLYMNVGKITKAEKDLEKAMSLERKSVFLVKMAEIKLRNGKPEHAVKLLEEALEQDPLNAEALKLLKDIENNYKLTTMFR